MKQWKASTARISQKIALISPHQSVAFLAPSPASRVAGRFRRGRRRSPVASGDASTSPVVGFGRVAAVVVGQAARSSGIASMITTASAKGWSSVIVKWIVRRVARRRHRVKPLPWRRRSARASARPTAG